MRIGITGSGGTGKTELAKALGGELGYPVIKEGVREWLAEHGKLSPRQLTPEETLTMQHDILAEKLNTETFQENYVADRTTVDNIVYVLRFLSRTAPTEWLDNYIEAAMNHAALSYDLIFLLPFGAFPIEDDGCRSVKPWYQFSIHAILVGILGQNNDIMNKLHIIETEGIKNRVDEALCIVQAYRSKMEGERVLNDTEVVRACTR